MISVMKTPRSCSILCARLLGLLILGVSTLSQAATGREADAWVELFNGKDLTGWTPKITGFVLGENFAQTFRVEDGLLKVRYDNYDAFDGRFGHLFWEAPFSNYHLLIEYRFVGQQAKGGPGWAQKNSGVMFHAQAPDTMTVEQDFPVSVEAQFLGGFGGSRPRPTNNMCSPGTDVVFDGKLYTTHCLYSNSATFDSDYWVRAEVIVRSNGTISHLVNGEVVLEYSNPSLSDPASHQKGANGLVILDQGFIALQSESHPIDFRRVSIRQLE